MQNDTGATAGTVETVLKLGGSILADTALFDLAVRAVGTCAGDGRLLVIPGGGPFADAVRKADRLHPLTSDAAHWMAVLAMDQSARLVADRMDGGEVVTTPFEIAHALRDDQIPVLAPSRWLQQADPLPHSWDVTSDSIAAWVAGSIGARRLVLVKPPGVGIRLSGAAGAESVAMPVEDVAAREWVDAYFPRALPRSVTWTIVPADQLEALGPALFPL